MQIHEVKPTNKPKKRKRIGRGGKRGTFSGRGVKGQKARAGGTPRPALRDIIKKYPKKRGYRFKPVKSKPKVVNLVKLEKHFKSGEKVTPKSLLEKGLIRRTKGKIPEVKILGKGKISKKLTIKGCEMSDSAKKALSKVKPKK